MTESKELSCKLKERGAFNDRKLLMKSNYGLNPLFATVKAVIKRMLIAK